MMYNKKIITFLVTLAFCTLCGGVANSSGLTHAKNSNTTINANALANKHSVESKEWAIVSAIGGYETVELLDYSINHY